MNNPWRSGVIAVAAGALAFMSAPAAAQSVEEFYKGNTLTLYVGYSPGGGYDLYARSVARHIGEHIPGNPTVVVSNRPGAGSLLLANELFNTLPQDGSAIGIIGRGIPMEPLFGTPEAKFDPREFSWIGSANNEVSICVSWHTSAVKTWEDMKTTGMIVGGTGPGADTDTFPKVLNNILDTKLKLVTGYPGGNDILLAMERGEVEGRCGYSWSSAKAAKADWLAEKKMTVLLQISTAKHADLPDVPLVMDLTDDPSERSALELIFARQVFGRPFLAPPNVPEDRLQALRDAFMATMEDPEFLAEAQQQDLELNPIPGDEIDTLMDQLYEAPADVVALAKEAAEKDIETSQAAVQTLKISGAVTKIEEEGRTVYLGDDQSATISGSRTTVTIGGNPSDRSQIQVGMNCEAELTGENGSEAKTLSCS
jgi:tripartite-type tricarboxylate transporter receptor subunit TctC